MTYILPELPEGYQFVKIGDFIREGDLYNRLIPHHGWAPTKHAGVKHVESDQRSNLFYIRKTAVDTELLWE